MMDEMTRVRFTLDLPIPSLTDLQKRVVTEIVRLEQLAAALDARRWAGAAETFIWGACDELAVALQDLGVPRDGDGEVVLPYPFDDHAAEMAYLAARQPYDDVEDWILRDGSGTGSARSLAVCYLGLLLGLKLDWTGLCSGLDTERTALAQRLRQAARSERPARLPNGFWRIFVKYRTTVAKEWESQRLEQVS